MAMYSVDVHELVSILVCQAFQYYVHGFIKQTERSTIHLLPELFQSQAYMYSR